MCCKGVVVISFVVPRVSELSNSRSPTSRQLRCIHCLSVCLLAQQDLFAFSSRMVRNDYPHFKKSQSVGNSQSLGKKREFFEKRGLNKIGHEQCRLPRSAHLQISNLLFQQANRSSVFFFVVL